MYFSIHTHSRYSVKDALPSVEQMVARAAGLEQPALGLTDHGVLAGIYELYTHSKKAGILPIPGSELYVAVNRHVERPTTKHMGVVANTTKGWENLIALGNHTQRVFHYKPVLDFNDLAVFSRQGLLEGLSITTGCFFGVAVAALSAGDTAVRNVLTTLASLFDGRVYVEVQNHNIRDNVHDDAVLVKMLTEVADSLGLPMVVANDAHYLVPEHQPTHNLFKYLYSFEPDSALFPGDGYWMCSTEQMRSRFDTDVWDRGMAGLSKILDEYDMVIPELDTFTAQVPKIYSGDTDQILADRVQAAVTQKGLPLRYQIRADEELKVICDKGFADYMLLVTSITDFMNDNDIIFSARGSAAGSVVCWVLGITQVDPLEYGLRFDRFLAADRVKLPDIDLDVAAKQRVRMVEWLEENHPCVRVGSYRRVRLNAEDDEQGSLFVQWKRAQAKLGTNLPTPTRRLRELSDMKVFDGMTIHGAGVLVAQDEASLANIPLKRMDKSGVLVTALDKTVLEDAGLVKIDLLGSLTIEAMYESFETLGINPNDLPLTDKAVFSRVRKGETEGIFQLQGWSAATGCKRLKPKNFKDIVDALALFRPAAQKSGATDEFLAARDTAGWRPGEHHQIILDHTKSTYGVILYQEQVLAIMTDLGMTPAQLSGVLSAVKASNAKTAEALEFMSEIRSTVVELAQAKGWTDDDVRWLMDALIAYSDYGFNKSHAVSYARLSYLTGWLLVHHPAVYWAALISHYASKRDKVAAFRKSAKNVDDITFVKAHVNHSRAEYVAMDSKTITASLLEVPKVAEKVAAEIVAHQPYTSMRDFAERVNRRTISGAAALLKGHDPVTSGGVVKELYEAGAFDALPMDINDEEPEW